MPSPPTCAPPQIEKQLIRKADVADMERRALQLDMEALARKQVRA